MKTAIEPITSSTSTWITVTSKGWLRPVYLFMDDEQVLAVLKTTHNLRERATLSINGENFYLNRLGIMSGHFEMENDDGDERASAEKRGMWRDEIDISYDEFQIQVYKAKWWKGEFSIVRDGEEIGTITPRGLFHQTVEMQVSKEMPTELLGFIYWLVQVMWNRQGWVAAVGG